MPDDTIGSWQGDCVDQANEAGHTLGSPVAGLATAGAALGAAAAEVEVPPAALETALGTAGAYGTGELVFGPAASDAISGLDYGVCAGSHYVGEVAHDVNDEAHQAAQAIADYISETSASNPHSDSPPSDAPDPSSPSVSDTLSSGIQTLGEEAEHAAHTVMEYFEPSTLAPEHNDTPAWSPDMATNLDGSADSHGWETSSLIGADITSTDSPSDFHISAVQDSPSETTPYDSHDGSLSSLFGSSGDSLSNDVQSDSHELFSGSFESTSLDASSDSHDWGGSSLLGGASEGPSAESSSDSSFGSSLFGGSSDSSSFEAPSSFDSGESSFHGSDFSSSSDHDSGASSSFGADS